MAKATTSIQVQGNPVNIQSLIFTFRSVQVMIDRDLAMVYGVDTKVLNQAVKRNIDRFPEEFRFRLTGIEKDELVTNCDRFRSLKDLGKKWFAFSKFETGAIEMLKKLGESK